MAKKRQQTTNALRALEALQADAKKRGLDKLTMREINGIIADVRREHDPLYGQGRRVSVTLSERMYQKACAAAEAAGLSFSQVMRQALAAYLAPRRQAPDLEVALRERPRRIVKAIAESTKDLKTGRYEP